MSTETQYTDSDNLHALGGAACTHQQEVQALQKQVKRLREALEEIDGILDMQGYIKHGGTRKRLRAALAATPGARAPEATSTGESSSVLRQEDL